MKLVTLNQRQSGQRVESCRHCAVDYEEARERNPGRCLGSIHYWIQPEEDWIEPRRQH
jgi:putative transposase